VATVLIIGASRGIGLETVKAAPEAGHSVRALARSARRIRLDHPKLESRSGSRWPAFVNSITSLATAVGAGSLRSPNRRMHVHLR
jgi:NAD(P)-dependent dehydrogenase (short-subunit alcohol dehydrogenase family)